MNLNLLLEMAVSGHGDRVALGPCSGGITFAELGRRVSAGGRFLRDSGAKHVLFLGRNGAIVPQLLLSSGAAGAAFVPLNYRLRAERIDALIRRFDDPLVVVEPDYERVLTASQTWCGASEFAAAAAEYGGDADVSADDDDGSAVLLFTSGTTAEPKIVSLSHGNLASYVVETVEFGSAAPDECALTTAPPYHVAAVASILTNLHAGRRVVYLPDFDAAEWLRLVLAESVTSAMLVPTMLSRIVDELDGRPAGAPRLKLLSYGGSRAAPTVVKAAMAAFPTTGFCNAYGLTETSSTVALLGPEEHRFALVSDDPDVSRRLSSVGRPVPGVEAEVRDAAGTALASGRPGELWLRGPQVSTHYVSAGDSLSADGWFPTRDRAFIDAEGYIFVEGRLDDTIIRGGENIAPSEVEDVLRRHPAVSDVAVVGVADDEWGQQMVAAVVRRPHDRTSSDELREWARSQLRGSRTPDRICFLDDLPYSSTGKLLRRDVAAELARRSTTSEVDSGHAVDTW